MAKKTTLQQTGKSNAGAWIEAFRLRTLPLALASIITGGFLAFDEGKYQWSTLIFAVITTIFLQVLSNLANDYGDAIKGTDNEHRTGPQRTVQSGRISPQQMKNGIIIFTILSFLSGLVLLYLALGDRLIEVFIFMLLGLAAIAAAIRYTIGSKAYGYKGMGDMFVFLFFGLLGVAGTWYLNTLEWHWDVLLPAASLGLLSTGVLNLNNMRDMDNDHNSGKRTVAGMMGYNTARVYHLLMIVGAFATATIFVAMHKSQFINYLFWLSSPLFILDLVHIFKMKEKNNLDPFLKKLALSSLLFSLLFGVGLLL
ncbi:MAG: 1,4-dihydroxy-2-naphthoate polyprenyltransferase [Bacteroidales bacterium]|nr:1,4-dihydroxy-2-naphthoate polyprenyltransferase [Bacteroidales bacterium]